MHTMSNPLFWTLTQLCPTPDALHVDSCCQPYCGSLLAFAVHPAALKVQHFLWFWQVGEDPRVSVDPAAGMVGKGGRSVCRLCYNPHSAHTLSSYKVTCQVVNGSTYTLLLSGGGPRSQPGLSLLGAKR